MLLRCAKRRKSAWELPNSAKDILKVEFSASNGELDLRPSVYEIDDMVELIIRTYAEHYANANLDPSGFPGNRVPGQSHVFVSDAYDGPAVPDNTGFCFQHLAQAHRELVLANEDALLKFIQDILDNLGALQRRTSRADIETYVRGRFLAGDGEWKAIAEQDDRWHRYLPPPAAKA